MNPVSTIRALVSVSIRRRFHPLTRLGFRTAMDSRTTGRAYVGVALMGLGWFVKSSTKKTLLYGVDVRKGKTVKVNVMRDSTMLAETTVAN